MVLRKHPPATLSLRHLTLAPSILFIIGLALRLYRLGAQSLWLDEGGTWAEVTGRTGKGWLALLGELFSKDAAYPLYHVLLKGWVTLAGDSEWALRFPSALAGAATVVVIYYIAIEIERFTPSPPHPLTPSPGLALIPALLFAVSPFALWYAQDAKVYSLLMLVGALELWALLRALARPSRHSWLMLLGVSLVSLFVHRLSLLALAGAALAYVVVWPLEAERQGDRETGRQGDPPLLPVSLSPCLGRKWSPWRVALALLTLVLAAGGVAGAILAVRAGIRGAGGHIAAGALEALGLTFTRFGLDRWPGDVQGYLGLPLAIWLLPCVALTIWGLALLIRDALARRPAALAILCMFAVPLALLMLALTLMDTPVYEARYATAAFPAWVLVLAYPYLVSRQVSVVSSKFQEQNAVSRRLPVVSSKFQEQNTVSGRLSVVSSKFQEQNLDINGRKSLFFTVYRSLLFFVLCSLFCVDILMLVQPQKGLFSGDAVKEQWRDAVTYLARQAHPDDLVILHPYYVSPMWDYYAPRVTADALPQPVIFPVFAGGDCAKTNPDPAQELECIRRKYNEPFFNQQAFGKKRALLLIAPDHARTVDPPPTPNDKYGWVGLQFQFSSDQRTWPCGGSGDQFIGVEIMCQSYPSTYNAGGRGKVPEPAMPLDATFGGELHLRGYSLDLFGGAARPGGTLPVTLYWDAAAPPTHNYQMFLHLCRDCDSPPLASDDDSPPLHGYAPAGQTTTWHLHDPVHDERSIILPADLPPGRYTLLLGVYPPDNPSEAGRLPVTSAAPILGGTRLVLGEVTITK